VAVDYGLVPLPSQSPTGVDLGTARDQLLTPGSRLIALMDLADLERLLRRHMAPRTYRSRFDELATDCLGRNSSPGSSSARAVTRKDDANEQPICLAEELTRGQAEILIDSLQKIGRDGRFVQ